MSTALRRALAAVLALVLVSVTGLVLPAIGSSPAGAQVPDFYTPPSPLPAGRDGDIVRSQSITYSGSTATRIMYLSRDVRNQPMAVTGTVLVSTTPWTGPGPRPVVAYAPFTAGMGDQCAVSKVVAGDVGGDLVTGVQTGFINTLLSKGFAVAETDYQGLGTPGDHTYVMRLPEAHAVLDVIRAAQRLPGTGLAPNGPVGIAGYSQGGGASAAAVELKDSYAPELDLKGAYVGAAPADLGVLASSLDGGWYVGFLGFALIGINAAYPQANLLDLANDAGKQLFTEAKGVCTLDAVFRYAFKQSSSLTKDGRPVSAYLSEEPFKSILAENKIGNIKPGAPVLVEHSPQDDVVPYAQGKQMAKDWCAKGGNVQFNDMWIFTVILTHVTGANNAPANAANWLNDRFNNRATSSNCGLF
jgi:hypothetical protein